MPSGPRFFAENFISAEPALAASQRIVQTREVAGHSPMYRTVDSGYDEFIFDNVCPDGSPKKSFHKEKLFHTRTVGRRDR